MLVTRGYGKKSLLITRGFGYYGEFIIIKSPTIIIDYLGDSKAYSCVIGRKSKGFKERKIEEILSRKVTTLVSRSAPSLIVRKGDIQERSKGWPRESKTICEDR